MRPLWPITSARIAFLEFPFIVSPFYLSRRIVATVRPSVTENFPFVLMVAIIT
jgi:hypothetical protein